MQFWPLGRAWTNTAAVVVYHVISAGWTVDPVCVNSSCACLVCVCPAEIGMQALWRWEFFTL